jgi:hypothetical protein
VFENIYVVLSNHKVSLLYPIVFIVFAYFHAHHYYLSFFYFKNEMLGIYYSQIVFWTQSLESQQTACLTNHRIFQKS